MRIDRKFHPIPAAENMYGYRRYLTDRTRIEVVRAYADSWMADVVTWSPAMDTYVIYRIAEILPFSQAMSAAGRHAKTMIGTPAEIDAMALTAFHAQRHVTTRKVTP